jgi:hypothetical protein
VLKHVEHRHDVDDAVLHHAQRARYMYPGIYTYTHVTSIRVQHSSGVEDAVLHHAQRVSLSLRGSNVSASPRHAVPDLLALTPCAPYSNTLATH